jgi:outer membrane protein
MFSSAAFAQRILSLEEAVSIALHRNTTLQKASNSITNYESNLKASYGNLLPNLSASGSWGWSRSEDEGTTYNIGSIVIVTPPSITENRSYSINAGTSWTLFDGLSNLASVSKSKSDLESAKLSLERLKQDIVFQTVALYYEVINAQQLLKVKEDDVKWNEKNLETNIERNKLGAVTLADVYAQQVRAGNAELEVIRAKNNFETAQSDLLYYLGLDVLSEFLFPDALSNEDLKVLEEKLDLDYGNISELVQKALQNRYDYKSSLFALESAYDDITIAESGYFPRLTNSIDFRSFANKYDKLFKSKTYSIGLSLSFPIFSGFATENRVQFAKVNAMNREIELSDMEREIKKNIQKTFLDLQAAKKGLTVNEKTVVSANENLKIEEEKYALGAGKLLDVLIANSNYTTALTNYINAQFAYVILSEQLKYYIGVLDYKKYE